MTTSNRTRPPAPPGGVPDGLPLLRRGSHRRPDQGACVMEYVSVLAGERWTDRPRCTPPAVTVLAQLVNDRVSRSARGRLALLAPALVGITGDDVVGDILVRDCVDAALAVRPGHRGLRRHARRAHARVERRSDPRRRPPLFRRRASVIVAFRRLLTALLAEPRSRRDEVLVDLLETAVRHVREQSAVRPERLEQPCPSPRRQAAGTPS